INITIFTDKFRSAECVHLSPRLRPVGFEICDALVVWDDILLIGHETFAYLLCECVREYSIVRIPNRGIELVLIAGGVPRHRLLTLIQTPLIQNELLKLCPPLLKGELRAVGLK